MPKKIQFTVEPIVSVPTGPKFAHIISVPSFYTFQHLKEIRLKKNELQLILCAYDLHPKTAGVNRTHITAETISHFYIVNA